MGWSSAGVYFEIVAHALNENDVDDDIQYRILLPLARELRDGDWDTLDESLEAIPTKAVKRVMATFDVFLPCKCNCCDHKENR